MIKGFGDVETKKIWEGIKSRKLPSDIQNVSRRKLRMLNNAMVLSDLMIPPSNRLEKLKGDREGGCSIRINDQWRVCFTKEICKTYIDHCSGDRVLSSLILSTVRIYK